MEGGRKCEWLMESHHFSNPSSTDIAPSPLSQHQHQEKKPEMELFQVDDHESKTKPSTRLFKRAFFIAAKSYSTALKWHLVAPYFTFFSILAICYSSSWVALSSRRNRHTSGEEIHSQVDVTVTIATGVNYECF